MPDKTTFSQFFRNLLDRLKIQVRTFTREQFKSVLANVQGTGYSPDIKANMLSMLKSLNQQFLEGIAQGRAGRIRMVDAAKIFEEIKKGKVAERGDVEVSELMQKAAPAMDNVAQGVLAAIGAPISMARKALQNGPMQPVGEAFFPAHDFLNEQEMDQSVDFVRKLVNHGTLTAKEALKAGMIDALKYRRDIVQWFLGDAWEGQVRIKAHEEQGPTGMLGDIVLGLRPRKPQVESMSIFRYKVARDYELQRRKKRWAPNPLVPAKDPATGANSKTQKTRLNNNRMVVGMVYLTGGISRGDGPAGGNHVVKAMSEAGRDNDVEAIVLRIDSGGGDALASDTIWEAVKSVRDATGKPVIASMGNMCASGGYYAASGADLIMAMRG